MGIGAIMSENERIDEIFQTLDWMIDKISGRKDCQTAYEILKRERMNMNLRVGR